MNFLILTAEEATWNPKNGGFVVAFYNQDKTKSWVIFQGDKIACVDFVDNIKDGLNFIKDN